LATHDGWQWLDARLGRGSVIYANRLTNLAFFGVCLRALYRYYYKSIVSA